LSLNRQPNRLGFIMNSCLQEVYDRLYETFGPQLWWPARSPFEVAVGAILVQNTNWANTARAIENLRAESLLEAHSLFALDPEVLAQLIRPAGYFRIKTKRLRNFLSWLIDQFDGDLQAAFSQSTDTLRGQLLSINGVGPETADSILLYAAEHPVFVVDAYTHRIFSRHGWIDEDCDYHRLQDFFAEGLPQEVSLYNEYHALLVRLGKEFCKKSRPKCDTCPLGDLLPNKN
jgi:endonuclease III related protein